MWYEVCDMSYESGRPEEAQSAHTLGISQKT